MRQEWASFNGGVWQKEINVRDFIQKNYTPYEGDESFLAGPTKATNDLWAQVMELTEEEHKKAVSWIWILILSPPLHPTDRDISIKKKKQL